MASIVKRYTGKLVGALVCFDRMITTGTIPNWCHADGIAHVLINQGILLFDYAIQFAESLRDRTVTNVERLAAMHRLAAC